MWQPQSDHHAGHRAPATPELPPPLRLCRLQRKGFWAGRKRGVSRQQVSVPHRALGVLTARPALLTQGSTCRDLPVADPDFQATLSTPPGRAERGSSGAHTGSMTELSETPPASGRRPSTRGAQLHRGSEGWPGSTSAWPSPPQEAALRAALRHSVPLRGMYVGSPQQWRH